MPIWDDIRSELREDCWFPEASDDVLDRRIHRAARFVERVRDWLWLEKMTHSDVFQGNRYAVPNDLNRVKALSIIYDNRDPLPLTEKPIDVVRLGFIGEYTYPTAFAYTGDTVWLDAQMAEPGRIFLTYESRIPETISAAYAIGDDLQAFKHARMAVHYKAAADIQAIDRKDAEDVANFTSLLGDEIASLELADDRARSSVYGGMVQPDSTYYSAAHHDHHNAFDHNRV